MNRAPAYQHYPKDHAAKEAVKLMDLRAEGAYQRLRDHQWEEGSIPSALADMALICRVPRAQMARVWPAVAPLFVEVSPGRLVDPDLEEQRARQEKFRAERSESGRRGNHAKRTLSYRSAERSATAQRTPSVSVLQTPSTEERTNDWRSRDRPDGPRPNPLIAGERDKWETEALRLTREIAALTGEDPVEIFVHAAKYEGAAPGRQKCNPATMSDDRLVNTVTDLRASLRAEQDKRKATA